MIYYLVEGINPEPWEASTSSLGRKKGGGFYIHVHKNAGLRDYQDGLADAFKEQNPDWQFFDDEPIELSFHFWRQQAREANAQIADKTNLVKAAEDALQGILYPNDRLVKAGFSRIVEQGPAVEPKIVIGIQYDLGEVDPVIWATIQALHKEPKQAPSNIRDIPDVF